MSDNKETAKHALLKELDDVQSLLDDAEPPLLQASAEATPPEAQRIRQLASERTNPFLDRTANQHAPTLSGPSISTPAQQTTATARPTLTNRDIDNAIDELVAEALPKLEKALRLKLRAALRRNARG
ncbi:MAG: hypothetical protein AOY29_06920 [Alcanivorax borkumensis]|jgi:ElaB/YqjD/DUF883 family membrane-anchored ribosome-binding protein|uniref:Uncharacterized protein n=1 Tax=Alcanivorax borkumensis (strain ATCC 700651 / DSM 11573 / NCIMB 13689 / SK2) TaxID=393595 RepID=Q0VSA7_ALCBS|nr:MULTISPECIES: hypothetical protein [Alcanivorax]OJH06500.1 MAG: hypothetical protein AOY29_06920 [Alcanivorax borkumensis]BAP13359.1 hypothetical protein AS19_05080 [Alcanivorax sp. NBRC 101098]CAL15941.1 hypothetical protein ABO_0493 [Alcanivorax borkumensis SK2]